MKTKTERIEAINVKIVKLLLDVKRTQRYGTWSEEEAIYKQIFKLEEEIKGVQNESKG